jgi:hypothetical protein
MRDILMIYLLALVHQIIVNAFEGAMDSEFLCSGSSRNLNPSIIEGLIIMIKTVNITLWL